MLHVIDSGGFYGAEVMLLNLVEEQLQHGVQPVVASIGDPGVKEKALEIEARKRGLPLKIFRMRPGLNIKGIKQLLNFCENEDFDLIHSHGYKGNVLLGPLPKLFRKKPMLSTVHGWTTSSGLSKMRLYEWLDAMSLRFVDGVVLVNKGMLQNSRLKRLNQKKLFVVDNGIPVNPPDSGRLKPLDSDIVEFCQDGFVVGSIGRYAAEKGFDILLRAFCLLLKQVSKAKLLLIGEGGMRLQYETIIAENDLTDRVMLTGYRSQAWQYLDLMQVYVISSLTEGLPITLLEAMRSKIPVIATRVGGIPDVLKNGDFGTIVSPMSVTELVTAILNCFLNREKISGQIDCAYQRFHQNYSCRKMFLKYNAIYKSISVSRKHNESD